MLRSLPRKIAAAALALTATIGATAAITGGSSTHTRTVTTTVPSAIACPKATNGHGTAGGCAPASLLPHASTIHAAAETGARYPDLSNNDPCVCGANLKAQGFTGLIVKANQGTGFIDQWAAPMVASARAAGLAVGAYDFDQDYTIAEAQTFAARLRAIGILPNTPNTFPAYLDVEFGNFDYGGLLAQIAYLRRQGYRVGIYTGEWYWGPHAGDRWPAGVSAWISGYPFAPAVPGLPAGLYNAHQFTDTPFDISVFRGPGTFADFVHATPAGPSAATLRLWGHVRNTAFTAYRLASCRHPQDPNPVCRGEAGQVITYEHKLWAAGQPKRFACFGPASIARLRKSEICWIVRPEAAYAAGARDASARAYARLRCQVPASFGVPSHSPLCGVLKQRIAYENGKASSIVQAYSVVAR